MSTSMPVSTRRPSVFASIARTASSCSESRSALSPRAIVSRGEWSVIARYS
jgi:hypothetical protein